MITRDPFVALLEKRATDASSIPDNDSAAATTAEYQKIQDDSRQFIHQNFSHAEEAEKQMSSEAKKIWSDVDGTKISGHPLMKLAMRNVFNQALSEGLMKTAAPIYQELAFQSFCDELEKIAAVRPRLTGGMAAPGRTALMNRSQMASPASIGGAAATPRQSLPEGSGTSVQQPGFFARAAGALGLR